MLNTENKFSSFLFIALLILVGCSIGEKKGSAEFPFFSQRETQECGPACLKMVFEHFDRKYSIDTLNKLSNKRPAGTSMLDLLETAKMLGFNAVAVRTGYDDLRDRIPLPCIIHWRENHFMIVYRIENDRVFLADPADSLRVSGRDEFCAGWIKSDPTFENMGAVLLIQKEKIDF